MKIPFSPPDITEEEIEQVSEALRSGWITTGPKTKELEKEVAEFCGVKSPIICEDLVWNCNQILLEAYSPGNCILVANKFSAFPNAVPRFEIKTDQKKNLKISANNINSYYKLLAYKEENIFEAEDADFDSFANIVRRIFSCLRSHSKDTPARKMDFIDNRIIGSSDKKRKVLNFLLDKKVLYTDEQDWLYKLDTDKVAQFAIMWNDVRSGDFASLRKLYDEYIKQ